MAKYMILGELGWNKVESGGRGQDCCSEELIVTGQQGSTRKILNKGMKEIKEMQRKLL